MRVAQSLCPLAALVLSLSPVRAAVSQPAPAKPAASPPTPAPANRVTYLPVKGVDYEFSAPDQVASGIVVFNLTNAGADLHALALLELPANHTLREFLDMYHTKSIIPPMDADAGPDRSDRPESGNIPDGAPEAGALHPRPPHPGA